jgi:hypothetical protein
MSDQCNDGTECREVPIQQRTATRPRACPCCRRWLERGQHRDGCPVLRRRRRRYCPPDPDEFGSAVMDYIFCRGHQE